MIRLGPSAPSWFPWMEVAGDGQMARWRMEEGSGLMLEIKMLPWGAASTLLALAAELAWQLERGPFEKLKM